MSNYKSVLVFTAQGLMRFCWPVIKASTFVCNGNGF